MSLSTGLANVSLKYNRLDIHFLFSTLCCPVQSFVFDMFHVLLQCWILSDG
jgi:hypothetical protein